MMTMQKKFYILLLETYLVLLYYCYHVNTSLANTIEGGTKINEDQGGTTLIQESTTPAQSLLISRLVGTISKPDNLHIISIGGGLELSWNVGVAGGLSGMAALVSAIGGIGGGALYVSIFNLVLRFETKTAAVLSNFMIFSSMIGTVPWYIFQKNPSNPHRPLIDYQTVLILLPNMLLGISIGVFCNVMFPSWLITLLLVITLSYMILNTCRGGLRRWRQESYERASRKDALPVEENENLKTSVSVSEEDGQQSSDQIHEPLLPPQPNMLHQQFPLCKISLLLAIWVAFFAVQLLQGEFGKRIFNIKACSTGYWLITSVQLPLAFIISASVLYVSHQNPTATYAAMSSEAFRFLPLTSLVAGILSGTLGIGGGIIINPLLQEMGMPPQVTAATCAFTILFSSLMSAVQFSLLGQTPLDYAALFSLVSLLFSIIGLQFLQRAIIRSGRLSLIIFAVTTVMAISATLMAFFGTIDTWRDFQQGKDMGLNPPC